MPNCMISVAHTTFAEVSVPGWCFVAIRIRIKIVNFVAKMR